MDGYTCARTQTDISQDFCKTNDTVINNKIQLTNLLCKYENLYWTVNYIKESEPKI